MTKSLNEFNEMNNYNNQPYQMNKLFNPYTNSTKTLHVNYNNHRSYNKERDFDIYNNNNDDSRWNKKRYKESFTMINLKNKLYQPSGFLLNSYSTPPDRYLLKSCLLEVKQVPSTLTNGSQYDQLSCSMWKKFLMNRQTEDTFKNKISLWKFLFVQIKTLYPRYGLYLVGSTLTGFGINSSDIDLCLIVRQTQFSDLRSLALLHLTHILHLLFRFKEIKKVELIRAKVPILKFQDTSRGLEVDLNCNNSVGIRNTHLLFSYSQLDWRVRPLVIIVKLWAHYHDINDAKNMTISSYSLTLMVIHFLQHGVKPAVIPCLHNEYPEKYSNHIDVSKIDIYQQMDPYYSLNTMSIGQLLVKFFNYYANFNFTKHAISVRVGSVISVESCKQVRTSKNDPHQWKYLCIEEPFDLTNTARSVYDASTFLRIVGIFKATSSVLEQTLNLDSIFKPVS